jgi:predicted Zn-dependent protease
VLTVSRWPAYLYDGKTAERQTITVTLEPDGVGVHLADGSATLWHISDVRQVQGSFSGEQVKLEIGTDPVMAVVVNTKGFASEMQRAFPGLNPTVKGHEQTTRFALWSLAALAVAAVVYILGAPVAASWAAEKVPREWEAMLGGQMVKSLAPESKQCVDPAAVAATGALFNRLTTAAASPYKFSMVILQDDMVNAFAAPGGFVVVTSGLLKATETPEQFAGVLAHEIQHITKRHTTRGILREAPMRLALASLFGSSGETVGKMAGDIGALSYRRGDESEADSEGLRLLQTAGIDPVGMVEFMRILEKQPGGSAGSLLKYVSSHPPSAERAAILGALAAQGPRPGPALDRAGWQKIRALCAR